MTKLLSFALRPVAARLLKFDSNFAAPAGEPAIVPPDSVSWRVFSNPMSLYIGGVAAVLLELGEPRVRTGVWEHSSFRRDPAERLRRTGAAAMVTVFGARSEFEALARRVNAIHSQIEGTTPQGEAYRASNPELLRWVQATASFAFLEAYCAYVEPVSTADRDRYYEEAWLSAPFYGVEDAPRSEGEVTALFEDMAPRLEPSETIGEFLHIMRSAPILPLPMRPLQRLVVRAAIELLAPELRERLGLADEPGLTPSHQSLVRLMARTAGAIEIPDSPWEQASIRLGLPPESTP